MKIRVPGSEQRPLYDSARVWAATIMNVLNPRQHRTVEERRGTLLHRNTLEMSYDAGVAVKHAIDHLVIIDHLVSLQHAQGQI